MSSEYVDKLIGGTPVRDVMFNMRQSKRDPYDFTSYYDTMEYIANADHLKPKTHSQVVTNIEDFIQGIALDKNQDTRVEGYGNVFAILTDTNIADKIGPATLTEMISVFADHIAQDQSPTARAQGYENIAGIFTDYDSNLQTIAERLGPSRLKTGLQTVFDLIAKDTDPSARLYGYDKMRHTIEARNISQTLSGADIANYVDMYQSLTNTEEQAHSPIAQDMQRVTDAMTYSRHILYHLVDENRVDVTYNKRPVPRPDPAWEVPFPGKPDDESGPSQQAPQP